MIYLRMKICVRPYLRHPSSSIPGIRASWEDNKYIGGDDDDNDTRPKGLGGGNKYITTNHTHTHPLLTHQYDAT
jgi:hypothetical protein